jgi:hypothetical protein
MKFVCNFNKGHGYTLHGDCLEMDNGWKKVHRYYFKDIGCYFHNSDYDFKIKHKKSLLCTVTDEQKFMLFKINLELFELIPFDNFN